MKACRKKKIHSSTDAIEKTPADEISLGSALRERLSQNNAAKISSQEKKEETHSKILPPDNPVVSDAEENSSHEPTLLSPALLMEKLRKDIKEKKMSVDSILAKAVDFFWEGDQLILVFKNSFELSMAKGEQKLISECVNRLLSAQTKLVIRQVSEAAPSSFTSVKQSSDEVVDRFCSVFRGDVVNKEK